MTNIEFRSAYREMQFRKPARTSRNTLHSKPSWFIMLSDPVSGRKGFGECSLIPGLSLDNAEEIHEVINGLGGEVRRESLDPVRFKRMPALRFALETALKSLESTDPFRMYDTDFSRSVSGIPINGLIWMDDAQGMLDQMEKLRSEGFRILKMKIGSLDFDEELRFLKEMRSAFPADEFELRLDANGAFAPDEALERLEALAPFSIHSIEQPIAPDQHGDMQRLCEKSPIPVALDEELIGRTDVDQLLDDIAPDYLILKPSLIGGLRMAEHWADVAAKRGIGWWATSALESDIGLNAIAQWCAQSQNHLPQGLGTGRLFKNNVPSPLAVAGAHLHYGAGEWDLSELFVYDG